MVRSTFGKYSSTHNNNNNNNQCNKNINRCSTHIWRRGSVATRLRTSSEKCARFYRTDGRSVVVGSWKELLILSNSFGRFSSCEQCGMKWMRLEIFFVPFCGWCAECRWCRMMISELIFVADGNDQCSFNAGFIFSTTVILPIHRWQMDGRLSNKWNYQPWMTWTFLCFLFILSKNKYINEFHAYHPTLITAI